MQTIFKKASMSQHFLYYTPLSPPKTQALMQNCFSFVWIYRY